MLPCEAGKGSRAGTLSVNFRAEPGVSGVKKANHAKVDGKKTAYCAPSLGQWTFSWFARPKVDDLPILPVCPLMAINLWTDSPYWVGTPAPVRRAKHGSFPEQPLR